MTTNNSINNTIAITTFTSSGTWKINPRTNSVAVFIMGGGGGGGSGRQGTSGNAGGGSGAGAGGISYIVSPASIFSPSQTVTIGAGGSGGNAQTNAGVNGNAGTLGSSTYFGRIACKGGHQGLGGTATTNAGGAGIALSSWIVATSGAGSAGGTGTPTAAASNSWSSGGGAGSVANTTTAQLASSGGSIIENDHLSTLIFLGGAGGIETGTINGATGINPIYPQGGMFTGGSGGGGGGGQSTGLIAGKGGVGGLPSGGGGGGGGSINGTVSGAGGTGGSGQVIVIEYF